MRFHSTLAIAGGTLLTLAATQTNAETIFGVLNNDPSVGQTLVTIDSDTATVTSSVLLGGGPLNPMASIDFRPATGQLYGIGSLNNQLYTIDPSSGALTEVGSPLPATGFIDFNPTVDAIRLISGTSNFRVNPDTGAVINVDGTLAYESGDVNEGDTPAIRGIGYTNSVAGATSTTLYDIDVDNDVLVTQTPANDGTLQTVGLLGVDLNAGLFGTFTGFDISGETGTAYLTDGGFAGPTNFYTVDLATGIATSLGTIDGIPMGGSTGMTQQVIADIAVGAIPEPSSLALVAAAGLSLVRRRRA